MYIKRISLKNFRNIVELNTEFSPQFNFFLGKNGQGKTNLLESLFLLFKGTSFRYTNAQSFINYQAQSAFISALFTDENLNDKVQLNLEENQRYFLLNEKKISSNILKKKYQCVLFSPESLSFIKESSESRRELIDDLLVSVQARNVDLISDFKKVLKTRNKILKDRRDETIPEASFRDLFESINTLYFKAAARLTTARLEAIKAIHQDLNDHVQYILNTNVDMFVDYVASDESILGLDVLQIEQKMLKRWQELKAAELQSGITLVGPHKHDIVFLYNQKDSRFFCSQGQQRAIILSFKMAQIVYHKRIHGWYPVLMLDDVLSELDGEKRLRLVNFLEKINTQIFLTSTEFENTSHLNTEIFKIKNIVQGNIT